MTPLHFFFNNFQKNIFDFFSCREYEVSGSAAVDSYSIFSTFFWERPKTVTYTRKVSRVQSYKLNFTHKKTKLFHREYVTSIYVILLGRCN